MDLEWDIINIPAGQKIINAFLFVNETNAASVDSKNIISEWNFGVQKPVVTRGENLFPGRFFVSYKPNTYTMTLKNLQYNDTGSFLLSVTVTINPAVAGESDDAVITISQITGEYGFFIYLFCASMTSGDEISVVTTKQ